jgi:hypothetical protein
MGARTQVGHRRIQQPQCPQPKRGGSTPSASLGQLPQTPRRAVQRRPPLHTPASRSASASTNARSQSVSDSPSACSSACSRSCPLISRPPKGPRASTHSRGCQVAPRDPLPLIALGARICLAHAPPVAGQRVETEVTDARMDDGRSATATDCSRWRRTPREVALPAYRLPILLWDQTAMMWHCAQRAQISCRTARSSGVNRHRAGAMPGELRVIPAMRATGCLWCAASSIPEPRETAESAIDRASPVQAPW